MSWDDPPSTKQEFGSEKQKEFEGRQKKNTSLNPQSDLESFLYNAGKSVFET